MKFSENNWHWRLCFTTSCNLSTHWNKYLWFGKIFFWKDKECQKRSKSLRFKFSEGFNFFWVELLAQGSFSHSVLHFELKNFKKIWKSGSQPAHFFEDCRKWCKVKKRLGDYAGTQVREHNFYWYSFFENWSDSFWENVFFVKKTVSILQSVFKNYFEKKFFWIPSFIEKKFLWCFCCR